MSLQAPLSSSSGSYHAYLVRLWQTSPHGPWRASVQCIQTGQTLRFAELDQLFEFLQRQVSAEAPSSPEDKKA